MSAVVRDNTAQGVMLGSPKAWEGRNSVNICSNRQVKSPSASTQRADANGVVV